jgi:nicotinamide mononucleotide transporter
VLHITATTLSTRECKLKLEQRHNQCFSPAATTFHMIDLLNAPAFHLFGQPASWAEAVGALLGVVMVVCNMRQIHWGWPLAFASSLLYVIVFFEAKLYGEAALQIFFAITAIWGWLQWLRGVQLSGHTRQVQRLDKPITLKLIAFCAIFLPATALFLIKFTNTDVPWADALPTVLSLAATYLLAKKYIENWPLWIIVNLISITLFAYKGLWLTVGLYAIFAVMAAFGWRVWARAIKVQA